MTHRVQTRRHDRESGHFPLVEEIWPTAERDPATGRWRVDGPGWTLDLAGDLPDALAQRICETAAKAIDFPTQREPTGIEAGRPGCRNTSAETRQP